VSAEDVLKLIGLVVVIVVAVAGVIKYLLDKHQSIVNGRFKDHAEKIKINANDIKTNGTLLSKTREEIQRDFVRHDHLEKKMDEHGTILTSMYKSINQMAKDLNQLIGAHNGRVTNQEDDNER